MKMTHKHLKDNGFVDAGYEKEGKIYVSHSDCGTGYVLMTVKGEHIVDCSPMIHTHQWTEQYILASKGKEGEKIKYSEAMQIYVFEKFGTHVAVYKFNPLIDSNAIPVTSLSSARIQALATAKKKLNKTKKLG